MDAHGVPPPTARKLLNFMHFFLNLTKSYVGAPPRGLVPPPMGNSGSPRGSLWLILVEFLVFLNGRGKVLTLEHI